MVYRALVDASAVAAWMVPTGMTSHVHDFDAREGGSFRISLTYDSPTGTGKTDAHTDTYHGRFVKLVKDERVVEVVEFETTDPALQGEMRISISLVEADGATDVVAVHDGLPPGLSPADNEAGWRSSLAKLAALVEIRENAPAASPKAPAYTIRLAGAEDLETLVDFTLQEAREAENRGLPAAAARRGVSAALQDSRLATYWVAEAPNGRIVASTSIVTEWSNFHGGQYWWIQSLFIAHEHRGGRLVGLILDHLANAAAAAGALNLRLYAHRLNERALRAYRRAGFVEAPYVVMTKDVDGR